MAGPFPFQPIQSVPEIFSSHLAPEIFTQPISQGCPYFDSVGNSPTGAELNSPTPGVIITGQQPGFMGGPLYTLYKIATTISLAKLRSEKGHPTIPVFWAGDDDDDLVEALTPQAWDPLLGQFFSGRFPKDYSGPRVLADVRTRSIAEHSQKWLEALASARSSEDDLGFIVALYSQAMAEDWTYSHLFCRCIEYVFSGTKLIIVRGNDPHLHEIARPFYERLLPKLAVLQKLASQGQGQAINERSIENPLFSLEGGKRLRLKILPVSWDPSLRPGVLLRSLIQDWLFRPVAVVVGPGEKAYLNQLEPLYMEMEITRSPLVPRLFALLAPSSVSRESLQKTYARGTGTPQDHLRWATEVQTLLSDKLQDVLQRQKGLPPKLAQEIAEKKSQRMTRNLPDYFVGVDRKHKDFAQDQFPPWVMPQGHRQERRLATLNAYALWGKPLVETVMDAAAKHLELGLANLWKEMLITVPSPDGRTTKEENNE